MLKFIFNLLFTLFFLLCNTTHFKIYFLNKQKNLGKHIKRKTKFFNKYQNKLEEIYKRRLWDKSFNNIEGEVLWQY